MKRINTVLEPFRQSDTWFYVAMLVFGVEIIITLILLAQWFKKREKTMAVLTSLGLMIATGTFVCTFCIRGVAPHTYQVMQEDVTWEEAREKCIEAGGQLAVITSDRELEQIIGVIETSAPSLKYVWIGGECEACCKQQEQEKGDVRKIRWLTGESCTQGDLWYKGEPSHKDRDGTFEPYLSLWRLDGKYSWSLNDQRNDLMEVEGIHPSGKIGYIVEFEP